MRGTKADAPRYVHDAFLKVAALVALRHLARLDALPPIRTLPCKNPSRLRNLLRNIVIPSKLADIKFLPRIKFFDFRRMN